MQMTQYVPRVRELLECANPERGEVHGRTDANQSPPLSSRRSGRCRIGGRGVLTARQRAGRSEGGADRAYDRCMLPGCRVGGAVGESRPLIRFRCRPSIDSSCNNSTTHAAPSNSSSSTGTDASVQISVIRPFAASSIIASKICIHTTYSFTLRRCSHCRPRELHQRLRVFETQNTTDV